MSKNINGTQVDLRPFMKSIEGGSPLRQRISERVTERLEESAAMILGNAQENCPVKTGHLQASANQQPAIVAYNGIRVDIGFNAEYAAAVHERLDLFHPQGQAKFLEHAVKDGTPKVQQNVQDGINELLAEE